MQRITKALPGFVICFSKPFRMELGRLNDLIQPVFPEELKRVLRHPTAYPDTIHETRYLVYRTYPEKYHNQTLVLVRLDPDNRPINDRSYFLKLGTLDATSFPFVYLYGHADITLRSHNPQLFQEPLRASSRPVHWTMETDTCIRISCSTDDQKEESTDDLQSAYIPSISIDRFHPH